MIFVRCGVGGGGGSGGVGVTREAFVRCEAAFTRSFTVVPLTLSPSCVTRTKIAWLSSGLTMLATFDSSMSQSVMSRRGFGELGSSKTESCACSCSYPALQGWFPEAMND